MARYAPMDHESADRISAGRTAETRLADREQRLRRARPGRGGPQRPAGSVRLRGLVALRLTGRAVAVRPGPGPRRADAPYVRFSTPGG